MTRHYCTRCGEDIVNGEHVSTPYATAVELDQHHAVEPCCEEASGDPERSS